MDDINVVVTGVGAPGTIGTFCSLVNNYDGRCISIIGTDIKDNVVGKYIMDGFYVVPHPGDKTFIESLLEICENEEISAILPQVTNELEVLSRNKTIFERKGIKVAVSDIEGLQIANNKYLLTRTAKKLGYPVPDFYLVRNLDEFEKALENLDYPKNPVVIKPPVSRGMRGFRILNENIDMFDMWLNEKPSGIYIKKQDFLSIIGEKDFPPILVMEYLPGEEYTVDALATNGETIVVVPRKRIEIKSGITFRGKVEKHDEIIEYTKSLIKELKLSYAVGFQFKLDEKGRPNVLECNPRIQGTMSLSTFAGANIIYSALKLLLDEDLPEFDVKWGTELIRYWGGLFIRDGKVVGELKSLKV